MANSHSNIPENFSNIKLLEVLAGFGVPVLVSGRVAEKFHGCEIIPTSFEFELILKPDLNCAVGFTKALGKLLHDFGLHGGDSQDAAKLATAGFRFKPFPASENIDILVAESGSLFDQMQSRSGAVDFEGLSLSILCAEDIFYLKQKYAEYWYKKYLKHYADLQRLKEKLASQS